MDLANID